jgi:glycine C-acetyltransferase
MQVMANHSEKNIADAVRILKTAKARAEVELGNIDRPSLSKENVAA